MSKRKILIAFRDEEETRAFAQALGKLGYDVATAKDGAGALETSVREAPSLIVAGVDLPVIDGEKLFQILRTNPHTSKAPFLFISNSIVDVKGFRTGIDIFLLRPINMEELCGRIRQALSLRASGSSGKDIEGKLAHMSLADIIQFLHMNKKEGELRISSPEASGSVLIKDGDIYNASLNGIEREKALFRLLQWTDGKFEFIPKPVTSARKIKASAGSVLMEGMRQIDEFRKNVDAFPDPHMLLKLKSETMSPPKGLQPIIYDVIQLARLYQKVEDIVEKSHYTDYEVYKTLSSLIAKGILEEYKPESVSKKEPAEFLTLDQAISIREKIISRFNDMFNLNCGKILVLSTSGAINASFFERCRRIPGFSLNQRSAIAQISADNPLGEAAALKLYGGMDLIFFSIPSVRNMGPLWKAFSTNLVGALILWDEEGLAEIKELAAAKRDIQLKRRVPAVHIFAGKKLSSAEEAECKRAFALRLDEPLFKLNNGAESVYEVFYSLFGNLIKEDYITASL